MKVFSSGLLRDARVILWAVTQHGREDTREVVVVVIQAGNNLHTIVLAYVLDSKRVSHNSIKVVVRSFGMSIQENFKVSEGATTTVVLFVGG